MREFDATDSAISILLWMAAAALWAAVLGWLTGVDSQVAAAAVTGVVIRAIVIITEEG